jgi:protein-L-isoaspartate(D-aspartate) O-methyltransferase
MSDFVKLREHMVRRQIEARGVADPIILDAFRKVPREAFVDEGQRQSAYLDQPLPIKAGQTISQPYIVALMIEAAQISPGDLVLEVGAGSGYAAAVMSRIARAVIGIERQHELVGSARERLHRLGYDNVSVVEGDGTRGWPDEAPFDAIVAAAAGSHVPTPLIDQLAPGGRLVMPIGEPADVQDLIKVVKRTDGSLVEENLGCVRFVPLIGEEGWSDD